MKSINFVCGSGKIYVILSQHLLCHVNIYQHLLIMLFKSFHYFLPSISSYFAFRFPIRKLLTHLSSISLNSFLPSFLSSSVRGHKLKSSCFRFLSARIQTCVTTLNFILNFLMSTWIIVQPGHPVCKFRLCILSFSIHIQRLGYFPAHSKDGVGIRPGKRK